MSINATQQIRCPKCGQLQDMTVWQSITVSDGADLKEDLLHGKVNIFQCYGCGHKALMPTPLLYHDEKKRLMISFSPCDDDVTRAKLFENIKNSSKSSGELDKLTDYNLRFITGYNDLLEKILIFDNGLHDKAIEVIKLMVLMQDTDNMDNRVCMFGKKDNDELEFLVQDKKDGKLYTSRVPIATYDTVAEQLRLSGVKFKSFDWEIVDADYAARLLRGANNNL
ncbi:MAG: CpXC domain-containing protein [Firmicutes bacterium]|nr:CpXC domain-containing protein [Bacillota bacterium]